MKAGKGRYVVLLCVAAEHAMFLLLLAGEWMLARPPAWVQLVLKRREFEQRMERKARREGCGGSCVGRTSLHTN